MNHKHISSPAFLLFGDGIKRKYFLSFTKLKLTGISVNKFILLFSLHVDSFCKCWCLLFGRKTAVGPIINHQWGLSYVVKSVLAILCLAINKSLNKAKTPWSFFSQLNLKRVRPVKTPLTGLQNLATLQPVRQSQLEARSLSFENKNK